MGCRCSKKKRIAPAEEPRSIHFGKHFADQPSRHVDGYQAPIPIILLVLKEALLQSRGFESEGIFRLSASREQLAYIRFEIDSRLSEAYIQSHLHDHIERFYLDIFNKIAFDPNTIAVLIKFWFRELPVRILDAISVPDIAACVDPEPLIRSLPEPQQSIFLWLLDLLQLVAQRFDSNRMSVSAVAIVIAPNLRSAVNLNELDVIRASAKFLERALEWRTHQFRGQDVNHI
eukprot:TRINITY_DN15090_c0_g1_i2.p1 TRINITY_DN15090_c0_g1~~TRINITY_DN15090_c0_g1_i2.p1  ORF type:complete len:231 (-),score=1.88 TRINITY_DN15090_c0_g1_i2:66-758(-)